MKKMLAIIAVCLVLGVGGYLYTQQPANATNSNSSNAKADDQKKNEKEEKKEIIYTVNFATVEGRQMNTSVASSTTLRADRQVDILSKTSGQILELPIEEGTLVEEGELLAGLDGRNAKLELEKAAIALKRTKGEFERTKMSYQKDLISQEVYDTKRFELETNQTAYDQAAYQYSLTQIQAPFKGTIVERMVEKGQTIQPSDKLFALAALSPLEADVFLPESQIKDVKAGQVCRFARDSDMKQTFEGKVVRVSPVVDGKTGTVKVTVAIHEVPAGVRPGSYVYLQVVTSSGEVDMVLPKKSLVYDNRQNTSVFVVDQPKEGKPGVFTVKSVPVTVSVEDSGYVGVSGNLAAGDRVVLTGKESLKEGSLVKEEDLTVAGN